MSLLDQYRWLEMMHNWHIYYVNGTSGYVINQRNGDSTGFIWYNKDEIGYDRPEIVPERIQKHIIKTLNLVNQE